MKKIICAVYDSQAQVYGQPIFTVSKGVAIRSFTDEVNNDYETNQMHKHPADFALFQLGEYDDNEGALLALQLPVKLLTALEAKNPSQA